MRPVFLALAILAIAMSALSAPAARHLSPSPGHTWTTSDLGRHDASWLHVKFAEGSEVTLEDGRFLAGDRSDLAAVNAIVAGARTLRRTFPGDRAKYARYKAQGEMASGGPGPDLSLWYDVQLAPDRATLATAINALNARPEVEIAHPVPHCEPAVIYTGDGPRAVSGDPAARTPDFSGLQSYLGPTPLGLDAAAAWARDGGRGEGMKFIDVELGWIFTHEDFNQLRRFYSGGDFEADYTDHGTAVLGEVVGTDDGSGVTGFAHQARWGTVGITLDDYPSVASSFLEAAEALDPGDVWLIELQMFPPGRDATPMEWLQVNFDAIWTSSWALGVVCVEAGANGSQDLDDPTWLGVFDRSVRDSGAIMVGAGTPQGRVAEWFTNHGSRMDVHAWGSQIVTTGYGDLHNDGPATTWYTSQFGGTSGASPMVSGAALCLQGIARVEFGAPLTPQDLRALLTDTGIPHLGNQLIGPRPDLGAAVSQLVDVTAVGGATPPSGGLQVLHAVSPFSGATSVRFAQRASGPATMRVYDLAGRHVKTITADAGAAGERVIGWDGRLADGRAASSGVYLYRLEAGGDVARGRLVKVR
jgi:hypothetical protein